MHAVFKLKGMYYCIASNFQGTQFEIFEGAPNFRGFQFCDPITLHFDMVYVVEIFVGFNFVTETDPENNEI